jgi:hypothetical protein
MTDYNSLKVPDLKKLLQDRSLAISGNKADLIARLQEDDKKSGRADGKLHYITLWQRMADIYEVNLRD